MSFPLFSLLLHKSKQVAYINLTLPFLACMEECLYQSHLCCIVLIKQSAQDLDYWWRWYHLTEFKIKLQALLKWLEMACGHINIRPDMGQMLITVLNMIYLLHLTGISSLFALFYWYKSVFFRVGFLTTIIMFMQFKCYSHISQCRCCLSTSRNLLKL